MEGFDGLLLLRKGTASRDTLREAIVGGRSFGIENCWKAKSQRYFLSWLFVIL